MMKNIFVNYNYIPEWIKTYSDDYLIYDRSSSGKYLKDFPKDKVIYTENIGNVDRDRLSYIIDHYDHLPAVFLLAKSNLFKYITPEEFAHVKDNTCFTPLLTQGHKTYSDKNGEVCFYKDGMYYERNDSWYVPAFFTRYLTYNDWARDLGFPTPDYIPFAPGGNYILTKEVIHRHPKKLYQKMKDMLEYTELPAEAQFVERTYYHLWS